MSESSGGTGVDELGAGLTIVLATICNQLIDRNALDRKQLIAELAQTVESLREDRAPVVTQMMVSGLVFALQERQDGQPAPARDPAYERPRPQTDLGTDDLIDLYEMDRDGPQNLIG
jgi:hypothetical protein